jgi:hypothetical protein
MSNLRIFLSYSKTPFGIRDSVEIGPVIFIDLARDLTIGYLVHFQKYDNDRQIFGIRQPSLNLKF